MIVNSGVAVGSRVEGLLQLTDPIHIALMLRPWSMYQGCVHGAHWLTESIMPK